MKSRSLYLFFYSYLNLHWNHKSPPTIGGNSIETLYRRQKKYLDCLGFYFLFDDMIRIRWFTYVRLCKAWRRLSFFPDSSKMSSVEHIHENVIRSAATLTFCPDFGRCPGLVENRMRQECLYWCIHFSLSSRSFLLPLSQVGKLKTHK